MSGPRSKTKYGAISGQRVRSHTTTAQPRSRRLAQAAVAEPKSATKPPGFSPAIHRIPGATYRLQFNRDFTFEQARGMVGYLKALGITDLYASPLFAAAPNSTHGYDICGYDCLNSALGTEQEFRALAASLRQKGMGLLLDMVPNHMAADGSNRWWLDLLEKGAGSSYAWWFDIDWKPPNPLTHGKVLLPLLEDHYFRVLEAGKLRLVHEDERFVIAYYNRRFPLAPISSRTLKQQAAKRGVEAVLKEFNGRPDDPASFQPLHSLLRQQHYRLAWWRIGPEEINYRRFFDVTELVSLRMELPEVFEGTHEFLFRFLEDGLVTGLRIDHPDGLWDPKKYCERLQDKFAGIVDPDRSAISPKQGDARGPLYVVVEKILTQDERLPENWPVDGTTGYDFLNHVNGLFVDAAAEQPCTRIYEDFTGCRLSFDEVAYRGKKLVLEKSLISEVSAATHRLKQIAAQTRYGQDFTTEGLRTVLIETISCFPAYRSYVGDASLPSPQDREWIKQAIGTAIKRNPSLDSQPFHFLQNILLLEAPADATGETEGRIREFVLKFQQLTGPAAAKGIEDTTFYNYNRFVSLNEVGGDPGRFGISVAQFHEFNLYTLGKSPHTLLATATHDTKRGEDLRARLNVLSEMPHEWESAVNRWRELNRAARSETGGKPVPSANDEYLYYQTLLGAWTEDANSPEGLAALRERISAYMLKAIKESKTCTSWTEPNRGYEKGVGEFVSRTLSATDNPFLSDFQPFQQRVAYFGHLNSLSQTLLKLTSPGVPDLYQGTELWDFSLVDPDNRRPVDYEVRQKMLREFEERCTDGQGVPDTLIKGICARWADGGIKLFLLWRLLHLRQTNELLFSQGGYVPLSSAGPRAEHVCAFARILGDGVAISVAPRLYFKLLGGNTQPASGAEIWGDTVLKLPENVNVSSLRNVLTGEELKVEGCTLRLSEILGAFPVALLSGR